MFFQIMFSLITIFSWISVEATLSYWKKIYMNIFVMQHDVNASKFYISIEFFNVNVNTGLWLWIFTFFANPKKKHIHVSCIDNYVNFTWNYDWGITVLHLRTFGICETRYHTIWRIGTKKTSLKNILPVGVQMFTKSSWIISKLLKTSTENLKIKKTRKRNQT